MMRSYCHRSLKGLIAHHLCPLHLFAFLIRLRGRSRSKLLRRTIDSFLRGYDCLYRSVLC